MILFDTPGIIEKKRNKLEERMMSAVVSSIQVWSVECGMPPSVPDERRKSVYCGGGALLKCTLTQIYDE